MKKMIKLLAGLLCAFAAVAVLGAATKVSADVEVEKLYEYSLKADEVDENTYTTDNGLTINVSVTYPQIKIKGHSAVTKRANNTIANYAVFQYAAKLSDPAKAEAQFGTDRTITIDSKCTDITRCGNILSISFLTYIEASDAAYPYNVYDTLNLNLKTGREITLATVFENKTIAKKDIAKQIKAQMKANVKAGVSVINPSIKKITKELTIQRCAFDNAGIRVSFDESASFGIHAEGTVSYYIPFENIPGLFNESKIQLIRPLSTVSYTLPYSAGTGYGWVVEIEDESVAKLVDVISYSGYIDPMLCGGPMRDFVTVKGVAEGTTTISFKLVRPWEPDSPAEEQSFGLIVAENLFITEINGEY